MNVIQGVVLFFAVIIFVAITFLYSKQKYSSGFSLIWTLFAATAVIVGCFPRIIDTICRWLGIGYQPTFVFLAVITALIIIAFYTYTKLASLHQKLKISTIEIALLADELKGLHVELESLKKCSTNPAELGTEKKTI